MRNGRGNQPGTRRRLGRQSHATSRQPTASSLPRAAVAWRIRRGRVARLLTEPCVLLQAPWSQPPSAKTRSPTREQGIGQSLAYASGSLRAIKTQTQLFQYQGPLGAGI